MRSSTYRLAIRQVALWATCVAFGILCLVEHHDVLAGPGGPLGTATALGFAVALLVRRHKRARATWLQPWQVTLVLSAGLALFVGGLLFHRHLLWWTGALLLIYACLKWALPGEYDRDITSAIFLVYWIHPLPEPLSLWIPTGLAWLVAHCAEWILHCLDVPAWAEGSILHPPGQGLHLMGDAAGTQALFAAVFEY